MTQLREIACLYDVKKPHLCCLRKHASPRAPSTENGVLGDVEGHSFGAAQAQLAACLESCDAWGTLCSAIKVGSSHAYSKLHMSKVQPIWKYDGVEKCIIVALLREVFPGVGGQAREG